MDIEIYGVMNEDRDIVWISYYKLMDWNDMSIEEDAMWKGIAENNKELNEIIEYAKWDKDFVILERIPEEEIEEGEIEKKVVDWINVCNPKYNLCKAEANEDGTININYILHKPEDVAAFAIMKEEEWDREDNMGE